MKYITAVNCMYSILVIGAVWVMLSLLKSSRDPKSKIQMEDLLLGEDGRISRSAVVMMGSFLLSAWAMVYMIAAGKMTEGYWMGFLGAWVAPALANKFAPRSYTSYNQPDNNNDEPPVYNREGNIK